MDETVKAVIDRFTNHFPSWDKLRIKAMQNVLQIFSFSWFFRIKELQKLLDKGRCDMNLKGFHIGSVIDNKL